MESTLPEGWIQTELRELVSYRKGKKPKVLSSEKFKNAVPYLNIKAIEKNIVDEYADADSSNITNGDEIFTVWDGARSGWVAKGMKGAIGSTLMAIKPHAINTDYLFRFLQTQFDYINSNPRGTGIPHVDPEKFWELQVPLAPLPEQQRIVEKLDALMARIASSKDRLEKIQLLEDRLFLSYIFDENVLHQGRPLSDFSFEGNERIGNKWSQRRLIGVSKDEGIVDLRAGGKKSFENYKIVKHGDFIYNPMRVDIGSIAIYSGIDDAITSPDYVVFRVNQLISPQLLLRFLKSSYGLTEINNNTQGSVRSRLYYRNLININFPYSGEEKQIQAEKLFKVFSKIKGNIKNTSNQLAKLEASILSKAFRGELVPQNEADEPAAELLKRIQAEKAGSTVKSPRAAKGKKAYTISRDEKLSMAAEDIARYQKSKIRSKHA